MIFDFGKGSHTPRPRRGRRIKKMIFYKKYFGYKPGQISPGPPGPLEITGVSEEINNGFIVIIISIINRYFYKKKSILAINHDLAGNF